MLNVETLERRCLFTTIGPDGFGYVASDYGLEAIDLIAGEPGVVTLHGTDDDASLAIPLGTHTFKFYGQTYTGSNQLFVSTNGLITLGSGNDAYQNANLSSAPVQAAIAAHWDDLNVDSTNLSSVVYQFDDANARLIVEWNGVTLSAAAAMERVTFQAILSLDTIGSSPIVLNYPDLDVGSPLLGNGGGATIGIKAANPAGDNVLLASFNNNSGELVGTGKAIRFIVNNDTTPPKVSSGQLAIDSSPQAIEVQFDEDLNGTLSLSDITLTNQTSSQVVSNANLSLNYNSGSQMAKITFPLLPEARLADGNYQLTIASAGVSDAAGNALDGDANGTPGGDYQLSFFFLNADANRDRKVDILDFDALAGNFGGTSKSFSQGNFDYSGNVDSVDLNLMISQFGKRLPPPAELWMADGATTTRVKNIYSGTTGSYPSLLFEHLDEWS